MPDADSQTADSETAPFPQDWKDVWALWGALSVVQLQYPLRGALDKIDGCVLSKQFQGAVWRSNLCLARACGERACIDGQEGHCLRVNEKCLSNRAFPMRLLGGKMPHQMASVFVRPQTNDHRLDVIIIGPFESSLVLEIDRLTQDVLGDWVGPVAPHYATLAEMFPTRSGCLRFVCTTPWVVVFGSIETELHRHGQTLLQFFEFKLKESLAQRGYKLSALALDWQPQGQPLTLPERQAICTRARNIGRITLDQGLKLGTSELTTRQLREKSASNGNPIPHGVIEGWFELEVQASAWPWIALLLLAGGGNMTDEGWGSVVTCSKGV